MRVFLLLVLACLLVGLSGCSDGSDGSGDDAGDGSADVGGDGGTDGDDGDDEAGDGGDGGDDPSTPPDAPRDPVTWHVTIQGNDFVDGSLAVQVGDTVVWTHADGSTPHTVTADEGAFDSGSTPTAYMTEATNPEFSFTFDEAGAYPYHCEIHGSMTDTITVLERSDAVPPASATNG